MALDPGTRLGPYEITGRIGAGGMGEVYRATDTKLGRDVAIKTLPSALAADEDRLARFEREAKLLAALNHPHIAAVYGLDEHAGTLYLAMELVHGETLEARLERGAPPVEEALRLALQIAEALESAHDKGVVHRDLKPANVMVTPEGQVKVLDFGLAKAFSGDPHEASPGHSPALSMAMTQQGIILGTASYMAPEQASGQATDQRADVWAFGVVLYEMLTGLPLYRGESVPHILAAVLQLEPDWNQLPKNLHPRLKQLLVRCLTKKPRNRYAGIADARVDIEAVLSDPDGAVAASAQAGTDAVTPVPVFRKMLPWVAGLALALLSGYAVWVLKAPANRPLVRYTYTIPEDRAMLFTGVDVIGISRDGRQFVYSANDGVYLRRMDGFADVRIPGTEGAAATPVFSPDGQSIAYGRVAPNSPGVEIARIPVSGGAAIPLARIGDNILSGIAWEADGTILFTRDDGIWRVSENGGEAARIVEAEPNEFLVGPQLLPGGDWVLFTVASGTAPFNWDAAEIVAQSLSSGERRVLRAGGSGARYIPTGHLVYALGNTVFAAPLDRETLEVTGAPIQVVSGVRREGQSGIAEYAYSSDGTLVYVPGASVEGNASQLVIIDRNGRAEPLGVPDGAYADARVSPDGRWVAYTVTYADGTDVAVYELSGNTAPRRLTFGGKSQFPAWSADSARVAYQSTRDGTASIYWQRADGAGPAERLTTAAEGETHAPDSFSSDGEHLSYTVTGEADSAIWILDLESMESEALIAIPGQQLSQSAFSPDGRLLAYQSSETGLDVFVQPYPLTGAKYQLPKANANHHPAWSADGTELFYFPNAGLFESVRVSTQPTFSFGAPQSLVDSPLNATPATRRQLDVMPDGSGFIGAAQGLAGASDDRRQVRVVLNWFDELKRLAPTPR